MSQSHEPSYYEIALTNRQVLVVFVVLLVCVVVAFLSGVWVGRGSDSQSPAVEVAESLDPEMGEESSEASAIGELNFFAEKPGPPRSEVAPRTAEGTNAATTLLQDVAAESSSRAAPGEPIAAGAEEDREAPEGSAVEAAEPAAAAASEENPTVSPGEHVIQVFSSTDQQQARQLIQTLTSGGYPAFLSPVDVRGQTMYRVRIGPYADPKEAEAVAERVRKAYRLDTWVTR